MARTDRPASPHSRHPQPSDERGVPFIVRQRGAGARRRPTALIAACRHGDLDAQKRVALAAGACFGGLCRGLAAGAFTTGFAAGFRRQLGAPK